MISFTRQQGFCCRGLEASVDARLQTLNAPTILWLEGCE